MDLDAPLFLPTTVYDIGGWNYAVETHSMRNGIARTTLTTISNSIEHIAKTQSPSLNDAPIRRNQ